MKKIIILFNLMVVGFAFAQTNLNSAENYIYEKNCLTEDCSKKTESVQYFDGLGRVKQSIAVKATPNGKDIAVPIEYDNYGRQVKSYLPIPQSVTQNGALYADPLSNASSQYGSEKIYAEKILESSPLGRPQQQKQVGNDWAGHPALFSYSNNTSGDVVKKYNVSTSWIEGKTITDITLSGTYSENTLYKSAVTDEDGNITTQFKNKKGQTILTRKKDGAQNADTYYVFNEYGGLSYIIPPLASSASTLSPSSLDNLCYMYRYDGWNRLVEKKIPGKGWEYMVYDKQNRLVLAQDANLRTPNNNFSAQGWMFTKYDQFGRVVYTGFFSNTATRASMQTALNNMSGNAGNNETRSTTPFTLNGMDVYYTKDAFPTGSMKILSVNYYDTYPNYAFNPAFPSSIMEKNVLTDNSTANAISTKSLPVMSLVKNIEDDNWAKNYIYYNYKGNTVGTYSINHLGGYTKTESDLDFTGAPKKTTVYHVRKPGEAGVTIKQRYIYDPQNRLLQHYHQVDSKPEELLSQNTYNELSQLTNKKVGNNLQSIDYAYNIRGWLTNINKDQMALSDLGGKLFSYKIKYNEKQGIDNPSGALFPNKFVTPKYNGSIAEVDWRTAEENSSLTPKRYSYVYDNLNRLTAAYYQNPYSPFSIENTESVDYDLNGNITKLYRTAALESGTTTAPAIDRLEYIYDAGNQVSKINDISQNPSGYEGGGNPITYDLNGNMKSMVDKNIKAITYNYLNLPQKIEYGGGIINIDYLYNAGGTRLQKKYPRTECGIMNCNTFIDVTDYLDGFQYLSSISSGNGGGGDPVEMFNFSEKSSRAMEMQAFSREAKTIPQTAKTADLQFFPTAEGFYDYKKDQYIYQHKDHLGNVRISFARNSTGALEVTDKNDYYPLGMNHFGTGNAMFGAGSYKNNKYNSKELQETGMYSYGWREYMPDIARWNGIDQLAEKYVSTSTYAYVANNPVSYADVDGRWFNEDGSIDLSGHTPGFTTGHQYQTSFLGQYPGQGGGGGYTFTGNAAGSMFNYFANGGSMSGINFDNGYAKFWTGTASQTSYMLGDEMYGEGDPGVLHSVKVEVKDFFTNLANNQYFSAGHLGVSESVSRFGNYALSRALNPNYINFTVLNDLARPYVGTSVAGIRMTSTAAANLSKYTRYGGYALSAVAIVATELQYADGQIGDTERWANHIMTGVGLIPSPWTIGAALLYGAVTGGYQAVTGRSIFNDMGLGPKK